MAAIVATAIALASATSIALTPATAAEAGTAAIAMQSVFELVHIVPEAAAATGAGQQQRGKKCQHDAFHHGSSPLEAIDGLWMTDKLIGVTTCEIERFRRIGKVCPMAQRPCGIRKP
jgi:hypothetical protein